MTRRSRTTTAPVTVLPDWSGRVRATTLMGGASPLVLGMVAIMAGAGSAHAQAVNLGGGNNIIADGRTQTNIAVDGNRTSITTNTVSAGTGFNSFSDFQQAAGTRVDLYVPDSAGNLVNIVRNGPIVIDGLLNSYKNGEIGGNVFFSSSQGFIVGANGSVNVGSLSVNTPTAEFLENVIRRDGSIDTGLATSLLRGEVPLSADGIISIAGTINAKGGVSLQGHEVNLAGGTIRIDGQLASHRDLFDATVNTGGLVEGGALAVRNGVVSIVASGNARIAGTIDASARSTGQGGAIEVRAGGDIAVEGVSTLLADGSGVAGGGGTIEIVAADTLVVEDLARFTARGAGAGAGGFVELSGKTAIIGAAAVDLSSDTGKSGTLLFDPYDLYIGGVPTDSGIADDYSVTGSILSNGASVVLQADNSITVVSAGVIDTRSAAGASGDLTIEAPLITIADGAHLRADVTNGSGAQAGNITLKAERTSDGTSRIVIGQGGGAGPVLQGHDIALLASAEVDSGLLLLTLPTAKAEIAITGTSRITASGAFTAEANATASGALSVLPVGVVINDVAATVTIDGNAEIIADSASLKATSTASARIGTTSLAPPNSSADGAVAVSTINSQALVTIGGNARLSIAGALELAAKNDVTAEANATPQAAKFGASVAVSVIKSTTTASIDGAANISAGSLSLDAQSSATVTVSAAAAAGGATEPDAGSQSSEFLDDSAYGEQASTADGKISVVGGLAISDLTSTTSASYASSIAALVAGQTDITAGSINAADIVADGSAVSSTNGVGVAVGLNIAHISTSAIVAGALQTGSLNLESQGSGSFTSAATSGAGASNVGVAGSLASNIIDTESLAQLASAATIDVTGAGAVSLTAGNVSSSTASATPSDTGATGDKVGVGVSAAISVIANRSTAEIADGASLDGAGDTTLEATGEFTTEGEAKAGSSGGISVTPALALNMVSNATTARVGTGSALNIDSLALTAVQQASNKASVSASAAGSKAAVGAGIAIALLDDSVAATVSRDLTATGSVTLTGMGVSLSELTVEASASGAAPADDSGDAPAAGKPDVDSQVDGQLAAGKAKQTKSNVGSTRQQSTTTSGVADKDARSASTSEGKLSVAAAVGVNVQSARVVAQIDDGIAIDAGQLTLRAISNNDASVTASGAAVSTDDAPESQAGIGAAAAVNKVSASTVAQLGAASHSLGGLTIEALKLDVAALLADPASTATRADSFVSSAEAGAGGSKIGIAGSLGLNLVDTESLARIVSGANVAITGGGAVSLTADNQSGSTTSALPIETGATGGKVGIGVSAAINIVANRSTAELADNAVLTGANAVSLSASGLFTAEAEAKAGAAGGISITPALGLNLINNTTTARLGSGSSLSAGSLALSAVQEAETTTKAAAAASGTTAAIGASLALALVNDSVIATTARNVTTTGDVSFVAQGKSVGTLTAEASAAGAKAADDSGSAAGEKDVDGKVDDQLGSAQTKQTNANVGSTSQQSATNQGVSNKSARSAKTSEGKLSVAAAVAVNVTNSVVTAVVPDGIAITAGGSLAVASASTVNSEITADGSAVADKANGGANSQIGIGVAAAVNVVTKTNTASLGFANHSADGVTVAATQFGDPATPDVDTISATAASGAGGSKVGIAGSLALNIIKVDTSAQIIAGAIVNAGTGASSITADQRMDATASAQPVKTGATGGKAGIGASVALNLLTTRTSATLADGSGFDGGSSLDVTANSALSSTTKAAAGSAGGVAIDAVVALAMLDETTTARIGTSATGLNSTGAVTISATSGGDHLAEADGNTKSGSVGIGAAAAVILGAGSKTGDLSNSSVTSATLARDVTAASLAITAASTRTYTADATATAKGGQFDNANPKSNTTTGGTAASANTLDQTKNSQQGTQGGSKVTVAAAVGVAAAQDVVAATLAGVTVSTTGAVDVTASNAVGMITSGSGLAVNSQSQAGVGIGVALGIINNSTTASIASGGAVTNSGSVAVAATASENATAPFLDKATAVAIAGASSSKVSVAGALAVAISTSTATASIGDNVGVASSGNISVAADNTSKLSAKALAGAGTTGNAGVGAAVATVYSQHGLTASIGAGSTIAGADLSVTVINHKISQPSVFTFTNFDDLKTRVLTGEILGASNYYAEAVGGAAAAGGVAVQGSFAVMVFDDSVNASIGTSLIPGGPTTATSLTGTGAVTLTAESDLSSKALAGGIAAGRSAGIGVSSAVIVSSGDTRALLGDGASIDAASFAATAKAGQDVQVFGITAAGGSTAGVAGVATVITSENTAEALLGLRTRLTTSGDAAVSAQNDFTTLSVAGGAAAGGTAGVGAAASVITVNNVTRAALADAATLGDAAIVNAGGVFGLSAAATQTGKTYVAAGAGAGNVAVGAGAAVYVLGTTTEALAGAYAQIGQVTQPTKVAVIASDITDLDTVAGAVAGGGTAGAGAGASVGVISKATKAAIAANAAVEASDVLVSAKSAITANTLTAGVGIGGTAGLAGAIAVYSVSDTTTAQIGANATVLAQNDVAVLADDQVDIAFLTGALGVGGSAAVGASASVAVVSTTTSAGIGSGASVTALGLSGSGVDYVAGYGATLAAQSGGIGIAAPTTNGYSASTGSDGEVTTAAEAQRQGLRLLGLERSNSPTIATARGVVVNASGATAVRSLAVGAAASGTVAVALSANVPVITASVAASIDAGARINMDKAGSSGANQSVTVAAASDIYRIGIAGSVGGGTVGIGAGIETAIIKPTTSATIAAGTVNARRDVLVTARATQDFAGAAAAAGIGAAVAVAGGASILALDSTTTASIAGTVFANGNVVVLADDVTRTASLAGSAAVGIGAAGVGGSVSLTMLTKRTSAIIAANASVTALGNSSDLLVRDGSDFNATRSARGIVVSANSNESLFTLGIAGAGGFYVGIAGAVSLQLLDIATSATVGNSAALNANNAGANAAQDLVVVARDSSSIAAIDGGVAVALGAGVSGAVDIGVLRNTTAATIGNGATVKAARRVDVLALQNIDLDSTVVSASGGLAGIAAGVSVYSIGDGIAAGSEGNTQINSGGNMLSYVQGQLDDQSTESVLAGSTDSRVRDIGTAAGASRAGLSVSLAPISVAGISANVGSASITAGGAVNVITSDYLTTQSTAGALALGGLALGAGVTIVTVESSNTAQLSGVATSSVGSLQIAANSIHTLDANSVAGSVGLAAAAQASVALLTDNSSTKALLAGATLVTPGAVIVNASGIRNATTNAAGAALGGLGAVGVSYAAVNLGGVVDARLDTIGGTGVTIGSLANRAASVAVTATSANTAKATTFAGSGGIGLAALGALAEANVTTGVTTSARHANLYTSGAVQFAATSGGHAETSATGIALAGYVAAGGSIAKSKVAETVATSIADNSLFNAGSIDLSANAAPSLTAPSVIANSSGSSGAFVGLTATEADARNASGATVLASASALTASGLIRANAVTNTGQYAKASGLAVGIIAIGANTSYAGSATSSQAILRDLVGLTGGTVQVLASGTDYNEANTTSGSGGLVAGAAANARTSAVNTTLALVDTSTGAIPVQLNAAGEIEIDARHSSTFAGQVDSTQAAVVGASGATISHVVASTVDARLGANSIVRAADLTIRAQSLAHNFYLNEGAYSLAPGSAAHSFNGDNAGWNVDSGSGGLINLPAGSTSVTVSHATTAAIGNSADILLTPAGSNLSRLEMEAYNETIVHQKAKLDSGGAIALANSEVHINVTANAAAYIGNAAKAIVAVGDIALAAWGNADLEGRSAATTYGLAGAPSGKAYASYTGTNTVSVGTAAQVIAAKGTTPATVGALPTSGTISLSAGSGLLGETARLGLRTTVDLFNKTAIPISTTPDARSTAHVNSTLTIADSQNPPNPVTLNGVLAAGDITLRAVRGTIDASAVGTGKDIYREALAKIASAISNAFGGGDVTFDYHGGTVTTDGMGLANINGLVATGIERHQALTVSYDPTCNVTISACVSASGNIGFVIGGPNPVGTEILTRLAELNSLIAQYKDDPIAKGAYQSEIRFLQDKLVALGLGTFDGPTFKPGAYAGPSPRDAALALVDQDNTSISALKASLGNATNGVVVAETDEWGAQINGAYTDTTYGFEANATTVLTTVRSLAKYAALSDTTAGAGDATFKANYAAIATLIADGKTASASVSSLTAENKTRQATITAQTVIIQNAQANLAAALVSGNAIDAASAQSAIAIAQTTIKTQLSAINTNNGVIATNSAIAQAKAATLKTTLNALLTQASDGSTGNVAAITALNVVSADTTPQSHGALTKITRGLDGFTSGTDTILGVTGYNTSLQAYVTTSNGKITTLSAAASATNSLDDYVSRLGTLTQTYANHSQTAATASASSGSPMAYTVDVADTLARLGNISVYADRLTGSSTGSLQAPGDAKITITNNTANTLRLGNLLMPTYDAGHVRLNGILVTSNADINAINQGGSGAGAAFGSVLTASNSSRPSVDIISNYNPDSLLSYNPGSSLSYLKTAQIAPDIILKTGSTIDNPTGAVNITSAAGNIYVNGTINAGSVSILAKNGDFVSSYVNGFDHIGGDPASFNDPTRASEAGKGITANGAISIAARYLNVNSTIQSGIANWTLNLTANPILTTAATSPSAIGVSQSSIDAAISAYQLALTAAYGPGHTAPSMLLSVVNTQGQTITLNMAPAGITAGEQTTLSAALTAYLANTAGNPVHTQTIGGVSQTINLKDFLSGDVKGRLEFTVAQANAYVTAAGGDGLFGVISPTSNIGVAYDAKNVQYVVDGTSVRGGYIQLYGQIMNTASGGGKLNVLDGFGTLNITNTSGIPVVLQTLSAGKDDAGNGRGTAGIIDITDVVGVNTSNPANPVVQVKRTVYSRDYVPGSTTGNIRVLTQNGTIDSETGNIIVSNSQTNNTGTDRTTTYNPTANQRYVWTTGEYFDNTTNFSVKQDQLFGSSALTISSSTHFDSVDGPHTLATTRLADGTYVTTSVTQSSTGGAIQTNQGVVLSQTPNSVSNSSIAGTELVSSTYAYMNSQDGPNKTGQYRDCNWWTLCIASKVTYYYTINQKYTVITTESLKADHAIGINFIGSDSGSIDVSSASNVVLTGNVTASNGSVAIAATGTGSIVQGNLAAQITGKDISLQAAGSVGGLTYGVDPAAPVQAAVAVTLTGGALTATAADGNVSVLSRGSLVIDHVSAAGNVVAGKGNVTLVAAGNISAENSASYIQAPRVSLTATNGAIGVTGAGQQLLVNTGYSATQRAFGDPALNPNLVTNPYLGLSATAAGDIGIRSTAWSGNADGTMLVDKVTSTGGNVRLSSTGHILDNNPVEAIDSRTYAQLLGYWSSLGLLAEDTGRGITSTANATKRAATIAAFQNATTQAYDQYWQLRLTQTDGGASYDANFTYTVQAGTAQFAALNRQFTDDVRAANPGFTDLQIADAVTQKFADYQAQQTALYHDLNARVGGLTTSFNDAYTYVASVAEQASLTNGATWTERELAFSLSPGALKTVTATNPLIKEANVSGRTVTIEATKGVGETIGAGTANVGVSIAASIDPANLTIEQRVALASAERSDLQLSVVFNGGTVVIPLGTEYANLTPLQQQALDAAANKQIAQADMTIIVLSKRPLNFNATTALNVAVTAAPDGTTLDLGTAHLASRGDAILGNISVPGETRIKVIGNISNAATSNLNTGNLILEAAQGQVGTAATPFNSTMGASTLTVRAQNGIVLNLTGDAKLDTIYSPGNVSLTASGALLNANNDSLINVLGTNVVLHAGTTIGTDLRAVNVGNNLGGGITATASGLINLYGPANNLFEIKGITSSLGSVTLTAGSNGVIDGTVQALDNVTLTSTNGRFIINAAGKLRSIVNDIAITGSALKMRDGATITADIGRVIVDVTGNAQLTGVSSGSANAAAVSITAGGHVFAGNSTGRAFDIAATTAGAGVSISAALGIGDQIQTGEDASGNDIILNSPNRLRILTANLALNSSAGSIYAHTLASQTTLTANVGGNIDVTADAALALSQVTTVGSQTFVAQNDLTYATLNASGPNGHIFLTSQNGAVIGGNMLASGSVKLLGNGVSFGIIQSGLDTQVTSTGDITGQTQIAGTTIVNTSGAAISLTEATSAGSQSHTARTEVTFGKLTTTGVGGNIAVTAQTGTITGGDVSASGSALLAGNGVTFGTIQSGLDTQVTSTGDIKGQTQIAGTTIVNTAGAALSLTEATSAGSQSHTALADVTFGQLTTTGVGGDIAVTAQTGAIQGGSVAASRSVNLTGNGVTLSILQSGADTRIASSRDLLADSLNAGGTITATVDGAITLQSATSAGTQTMVAGDDLRFAALTTTGPDADINLTSIRGALRGGTISASGSANLLGNGVSFDALQTALDARVTSSGDITGQTQIAGGTIVNIAGRNLTLALANSVGAQSHTARNDVVFSQLTTTGVGGDIAVTAETGAIRGGSISASGSAYLSGNGITLATVQSGRDTRIASNRNLFAENLLAGGTITASANGSITLQRANSMGTQDIVAGDDLNYGALTTTGVGADINLTSIAGALRGGTLASSGSTKLFGNGVFFDTIFSGVDSRITSTGDIIGNAQIAAETIFDSAGTETIPGSIRIANIRSRKMGFDATGALVLPNLEVGETVVLGGGQIDVGITQVPSGPLPLSVTLTGGRGGVGTNANVRIDAPAGVIIPSLRFIDTLIATTANQVTIQNAYVPGSLTLVSPLQTIVANNRSPGPLPGNTIQLYQPGFAFSLGLDRYHTQTNAFIVRYDASSQAAFLVNDLAFNGVSLVRDSVRAMINGDPIEQLLFAMFGADDDEEHDVAFDAFQNLVVIDGVAYPIARVGNAPAVQLSQN